MMGATTEYFWLCQRCTESLVFEFREGDRHPALVSRHIVAGNCHQVEYKL